MKINFKKYISSIPSFFSRRKNYSALFAANSDNISFDGKTQYDFLKYNEISLYVNKAIEKRAEKVSEVQFVLKKGDKVIDRHPLVDLLNKPNQFHTGKQFWKAYQKHMDITGNAFIYLEKSTELFDPMKVKAMHLLRPDLVTVQFDTTGNIITGYEYKRAGGATTIYKPEDILYSFEPDPMNLLKGVSLLKAGVRAIETEVQLAEYQAKILKNGGKVDGVFKFKAANLTKVQMEEIKKSYKDQREELGEYDNNLFLGGDTDYVQLGLKPEELSYLASKGVTLDDISILTSVPKSILAVSSQETYANADASISIFLRETIKPLITSLVTMLDWRFIPAEFDLDFIDPTPEDVDRKIKLVEAAHSTNSVTINEKRKVLGFEPYKNPEADQILVPFNLSPLGSGDEGTSGAKKKSVSDFSHPLRDDYFRKKYGDVMVKRMDKRETKLISEVIKYFEGQSDRIVGHLTETRSFRKKSVIDDAFNHQLEIQIAKGMILPILQNILEDAGKDAFNLLDSDYSFHLSSDIGTWLDNRAKLFAEEINATTFDKLKNQFQESLNSDDSRQDLIKRIKDTYDGFTAGRAKTIARTEVHGATTKGTFEGYKQAGAPIKIWVTAGDADVRSSHAYLDGEERPINMPFSNGLDFPGDPKGRAGETINCRCVI
ncbi:MAG TPA: phage portal protein [Candidatus Paceibacterota bacterium]